MLQISKKTQHSVSEALQGAIEYFGPAGLGLSVKRRDADSALLEGGGGYVLIGVQTTEQGSEMLLETREWEQPVRDYLAEIES